MSRIGFCRSFQTFACSSGISCSTARRHFSQTSIRGSAFHYRKRRVTTEDAVDPLTKPTNIDKGALHIVSVPIGNLKDFTIRALDVLHDVDYIITSDRPATKTLLDLVNITSQGRLIHFSRSNQTATCAKLVELLRGGRSMALVTTSGTPCVGDIGAALVQEMQSHNIRVTPVPGPSAVMGALAMCGVTGSRHDPQAVSKSEGGDAASSLGAGRSLRDLSALQDGSFFFGNMLPEPHGARLRYLRATVCPATHPCVFYEVPRRLLAVLQDIAALLPKRRVYIAHEITKLNESLHADTAENLVRYYMRHEAQAMLEKGQLVLIIGGATAADMGEWLLRESSRRRRLRRSIGDLMSTSGKGKGKEASATTTSNTHASAVGSGEAPRRAKTQTVSSQRKKLKKKARDARLKRKRNRLIGAIEKEQERLRLNMSINRDDASRL